MLPTEQGSCAYSFAKGPYSAGTFDIGLAADFDFYIASVTGIFAYSAAAIVVEIGIEGGAIFWGGEGTLSGSAGELVVRETPGAVIEAGQNLIVNCIVEAYALSIDGYVLTPSRVALFG